MRLRLRIDVTAMNETLNTVYWTIVITVFALSIVFDIAITKQDKKKIKELEKQVARLEVIIIEKTSDIQAMQSMQRESYRS